METDEIAASPAAQTPPEPASAEEEQLILASQAGDIQAFNQLIERYQTQVYNLCRRMLGDPELAADATQETFLNAFEHIGRFRGGTLKTWLLRIAANACYDVMRHRKRRPATSLDEILDDEDDPKDFAGNGELPEQFALRRELRQLLLRALNQLPPEQRMVVILSDIQGLSYDEIAEVTRAELGTVKSRLSRARAKLRDFLERHRELLPRDYRQQE
ncbi:MAG: sigma-70 family RNA polymerase sigma factor [Chloroflexota bacterium]|nr:sigma-70 family RNA polymerase sigma factor [Dehalococcoidia bacterium]MDW8254941.1 sigma-70 family RNA polymerase sigma factor [Chloroflexota bacterium]